MPARIMALKANGFIDWTVVLAGALSAAVLATVFFGFTSAVGLSFVSPLTNSRVPRMFDALALARGDGRHARLLKVMARVELLILDDWGLASLTPDQGRDMLEIVDDRHGRGSTIITSQLAVEHWHEAIANPTIADAILDRLVHNAHRLNLAGESFRKTAAKRSQN